MTIRATRFSFFALAVATLTSASAASGAPRHHRGLRQVSVTTTTEGEGPHHWLVSRLPSGGALAEGGSKVVHTVHEGDTWESIADRYLDLTSVYHSDDLAKALAAANPSVPKSGPQPGERVVIPDVLTSAPKTGPRGRIGLPKDGAVKGLYVRGVTAGSKTYPAFLDRIAQHGMNAIVLDVKDYDGPLTYPSKVPFALESGAVKDPPIRSYARAVQFAHDRGIYVIARVSCFNDQLMSKAHPGMAIRGISGHPYRNGWVDPKNERQQDYILALAKEAIEAGADEIQLDYVRFPVTGMKYIDFGLDTKREPNAKIEVISQFVDRVHTMTRAHGVPLSLDVFGVIAFGKQTDMQNLGQDPVELAQRSEFLSAMVYPSHYDPGFMGLEEPGAHPELVGMGVKHMLAEMEERGLDVDKSAKIRPWLQAMRHRSSNYGPGYIQEEIRTGDKAGASGWLLWNASQTYDVAWRAVHKPQQPEDKRLSTVSFKHR
jgi:hypothetical protein